MRITGTSAKYRTDGGTDGVTLTVDADLDAGTLTITVHEDGGTPQSSILTPVQARLIAQDLTDYARRMEA